jgi:hypothetical protein
VQSGLEAEELALRAIAHDEVAVGVARDDPDVDRLEQRVGEALAPGQLRVRQCQLARQSSPFGSVTVPT